MMNKIHKTNLILSFFHKIKLRSKAPLTSSRSKSRTTIQNVHITFSYRKCVCCVFTFTVAIACSTFKLWRQTSSARTAAIGHGQVILYRLVCTLRSLCTQNFLFAALCICNSGVHKNLSSGRDAKLLRMRSQLLRGEPTVIFFC